MKSEGEKSKTVLASVTETLKIDDSLSSSKTHSGIFSGDSLTVSEAKDSRYKACKVVELVVLFAVIVITWSLLSLPILFYSLDSQEVKTILYPVFSYCCSTKSSSSYIQCHV